MTNVVVYALGWLLFVAGQAQNSIASKTNGLPTGWEGFKLWIKLHAVTLAQRAFWSGLGYGFIVHTTGVKLEAVGFHVTSTIIAGLGGWVANGILYQFMGLFPGLRVEVADLAPPPNAQVVPAVNEATITAPNSNPPPATK